MNILVTGGAGYIGSHACKALARAGVTPVTYDNLVYGHEWAVRWGPLEVGDIRDQERLAEVFDRYRPAAVMHFAAFAYVGESMEDPAKYYHNNLWGTLSLLEAMRAAGVGRLVFSSSCATYGAPSRVPIAEDLPQEPINPYGRSKFMSEQILADFGRAYGLASVALRYFNAAGADPDGEIGEDHDPETHLIPLVIQSALGLRDRVLVYGDDYDTPDGTCIRDYIHVSDIAEAHVLALRVLEQSRGFTAYNLGNGRGFSVKEVIDTTARIAGKAVPVAISGRRRGDPACLVGDAQRIQRDFGWTTRFPDLETIIATAWRWHRAKVSLPGGSDSLASAGGFGGD